MKIVFLLSEKDCGLLSCKKKGLLEFFSFVADKPFFDGYYIYIKGGITNIPFIPEGFKLLYPSDLSLFSGESILFVNGLKYFDVDYDILHSFHREKNALLTFPLRFKLNFKNEFMVEVDTDFLLKDIRLVKEKVLEGYVYEGIFLGKMDVLQDLLNNFGEIDLENCVAKGKVFGLPLAGKVLKGKAGFNEKKKRIVFLDRDGIINVDTGYVYRIEDFKPVDGVIDFLKKVQPYFDGFIIITNQAGIAKGKFREKDFVKFQNYIIGFLRNEGINVIDSFYCPFHHLGVVDKYRRESLLRKPMPGMLLLAAEKHSVDLPKSIMIGDRDSDRINLPYLKSYILRGVYEIKDEADSFGSFDEIFWAILKDLEGREKIV